MTITRLEPRERVALDGRPIEVLCRLLGDRTEAAVGNAMEELAVWLSRADRLCHSGRHDDLKRLTTMIAATAPRLGMPLLARVASEAAGLCAGPDDTALAAVTARMTRIGETSLVAVWNPRDRSG